MDYKTMHGFAQGLLEDMPAFVPVADYLQYVLFQGGGLIPRPLGSPKSQPSPIPRGLPRGVASLGLER
jgi:hypothetical protein